MAEAKFKRIKMVSPKGTFRFPKIAEIDYGTKDYPKPDGEYSVQLILNQEDATTKAFLAKLAPLYEAAIESGKQEAKALKIDSRKKLQEKNGKDLIQQNKLFTVLYDEETEEPTGEIVFKFAMKAGGTTKQGKKWSRKPGVFDAKGNPITKIPAIWGGTVGKVSFEVTEGGYFIPGTGAVGLSMSLAGVQIIELVAGGQRTAKDHGFTAEEGYQHEDKFEDEEDSKDEDTDAPGEEENGDF